MAYPSQAGYPPQSRQQAYPQQRNPSAPNGYNYDQRDDRRDQSRGPAHAQYQDYGYPSQSSQQRPNGHGQYQEQAYAQQQHQQRRPPGPQQNPANGYAPRHDQPQQNGGDRVRRDNFDRRGPGNPSGGREPPYQPGSQRGPPNGQFAGPDDGQGRRPPQMNGDPGQMPMRGPPPGDATRRPPQPNDPYQQKQFADPTPQQAYYGPQDSPQAPYQAPQRAARPEPDPQDGYRRAPPPRVPYQEERYQVPQQPERPSPEAQDGYRRMPPPRVPYQQQQEQYAPPQQAEYGAQQPPVPPQTFERPRAEAKVPSPVGAAYQPKRYAGPFQQQANPALPDPSQPPAQYPVQPPQSAQRLRVDTQDARRSPHNETFQQQQISSPRQAVFSPQEPPPLPKPSTRPRPPDIREATRRPPPPDLAPQQQSQHGMNLSPQMAQNGPPSPLNASRSFDLPRPNTSQTERSKSRPPPLDRSVSAEHVVSQKQPRRPLMEPVSPTIIPQDNAFPFFPTKKAAKKDTESKAQSSPLVSPSVGTVLSPTKHAGGSSKAAAVRSPPMGPGSLPSPKPQQASFEEFSLPTRAYPNAPATQVNERQQGHAKNPSQSEVLADDYMNDIGRLDFGPAVSRDAEIEAAMPNFDGPAPGNSRGRGGSIDEHLPTAPALRQPLPMANSYNLNNPSVAGPYGAQNGRGPPSTERSFSRPRPEMPNILGPHPANQPPSASMYSDQYAPRQANLVQRQPLANPMSGYGQPVTQRPGTADQYGRQPMPQQSFGRPNMPPGANRPDGYRAESAPPQIGVNAYGAPMAPPLVRSPNSNPDSIAQHPVPVRPGLMEQTQSASQARTSQSAAPRGSTDSKRSSVQLPVTQAEINQLQTLVNAHPQDSATALLLAKKLVEAATVLASENGKLDQRATSKNREKYIFEAHRRIKKLVSAGYPDAMFYLADCHGAGALGLEEDPKEAFNLYQQAAKLGHAQAAYRTAVCCELGPEEGGGTRRDVQKAVQWYKRAAQLQDVAAMFKLGVICLKGLLSQPRNILEAERWLKRAAERADKENPHALHELGLLYESDQKDREIRDKIVPDDKYAKELFFQAAGLGLKSSQFRLGQAYEYGSLGLAVDARNSIAWYSKAAAQGEHGAQLALSGWYLTGAEGILDSSDQEAYLWARKAASADPPLAKAMFAMGYYTETGIGCVANLDEAKRWYGRAASYKFPKAIDRLEDIKKNGGKVPKDAKAAQRLQRKDVKEKVR